MIKAPRYAVILADPPWDYRVWSKTDHGRTAKCHYLTMSIKDICALPVASIAAQDSALFLWATYPLLEESFKVIKAWGFTYIVSQFQNGLPF